MTRIPQREWVVDLEFRASGAEHAGGNFQIWYTKESLAQLGTSSLYTVEKFEGLVLVVDRHGNGVRRADQETGRPA